jgi:hypothetical protein
VDQTKRNKKLIIITIAIIAVIVSAFVLNNVVRPKMMRNSIILDIGNVPAGSGVRYFQEALSDRTLLTVPFRSKLYFEYTVSAVGSDSFNAFLDIYPINNNDLEFHVVLRENRPVRSITLEKGTYEIRRIKVAWSNPVPATNVTITIILKSWEFA